MNSVTAERSRSTHPTLYTRRGRGARSAAGRAALILAAMAAVSPALAQHAGDASAAPSAQSAPTAADAARGDAPRAETERLLLRGARFLLSAQERDGGFASAAGPGVTALCVRALAGVERVGPNDPAVRRGVEFVLKAQRPDGGVYSGDGLLKNYESSVALSMFAALDGRAYAAQIEKLRKFLIDNQWDEADGRSIDDPWYGGAGYGRGKRPDLSNTQMMLEALHDSGLPPEHETYRKALVFIQRCQMLAEHNDQGFARGARDGGFIYSPAEGGESKAGAAVVDGREQLRSYGSMTYAGFKSMIYCGLTKDDPRVRAALAWIGRHWTLDYNPNMPEKQSREGLYYYYHVFGRAMQAYGEREVRDAQGRRHDWRRELIEKLASLQKADGSWVNEEDRWMEGMPELTTAYAMLALHATRE